MDHTHRDRDPHAPSGRAGAAPSGPAGTRPAQPGQRSGHGESTNSRLAATSDPTATRGGGGHPDGRGDDRGDGRPRLIGHRVTPFGPALPTATLAALAAATNADGRGHRGRSPLATLEATFVLLCTGPEPLSLDTSACVELPNRIPLVELRVRLAGAGITALTRVMIWAALVARARTEDQRSRVLREAPIDPGDRVRRLELRRATWTVAVMGMLVPDLVMVCDRVGICPGVGRADVEAAALGAALAELHRPDLATPAHARIRAQLTRAALRGARGLVATGEPAAARSGAGRRASRGHSGCRR